MHLTSGVLRCPQVSSGVLRCPSELHVTCDPHCAGRGEMSLQVFHLHSSVFHVSEEYSGEIKQDTNRSEPRKTIAERNKKIFCNFYSSVLFVLSFFILFPCIHIGPFILSCVSFILSSCLVVVLVVTKRFQINKCDFFELNVTRGKCL